MIEGQFWINDLSFYYFSMQDRMDVVKEELVGGFFTDRENGMSVRSRYSGPQIRSKIEDCLPLEKPLKINVF